MGRTTRLQDKTGPGTKETFAKEIIAIKGRKERKMPPFTKKERI